MPKRGREGPLFERLPRRVRQRTDPLDYVIGRRVWPVIPAIPREDYGGPWVRNRVTSGGLFETLDDILIQSIRIGLSRLRLHVVAPSIDAPASTRPPVVVGRRRTETPFRLFG